MHDSKANAIMATSSFDRANGTFTTATTQPINNFKVQTQGGNIIQGSVNRLRVAEVYFPYQVPTVIAGYNNNIAFTVFRMTNYAGAPPLPATITQLPTLNITLPTGYYLASEMQSAVSALLAAYLVAQSIPAGTFTFTLDPVEQSFTVLNTSTFSAAPSAVNYIGGFQPFAALVDQVAPQLQQPNLAWTLGFRQVNAKYPPVKPIGGNTTGFGLNTPWSPFAVPAGFPTTGGTGGVTYPIFAPGYAPQAIVGSTYLGKYTDYIDICSPTLCQAQFVRDGNTNQQVIRRDQICRLWIASEISTFTTNPDGTRPFVIHRQFKNAKVMKWTAERSIDAIDIQLYDMYGQFLPIAQLLPTTAVTAPNYVLNNGYGDFGITFLVEENEDELVPDEKNYGYRM